MQYDVIGMTPRSLRIETSKHIPAHLNHATCVCVYASRPEFPPPIEQARGSTRATRLVASERRLLNRSIDEMKIACRACLCLCARTSHCSLSLASDRRWLWRVSQQNPWHNHGANNDVNRQRRGAISLWFCAVPWQSSIPPPPSSADALILHFAPGHQLHPTHRRCNDIRLVCYWVSVWIALGRVFLPYLLRELCVCVCACVCMRWGGTRGMMMMMMMVI